MASPLAARASFRARCRCDPPLPPGAPSSRNDGPPDAPLRVVMIGSDFEVRVWETLLRVPFACATT